MGRAADFEAPLLGTVPALLGAGGEIAASVLSPWGVGTSRGSWGPEEELAGYRADGVRLGASRFSRPGAPRLYALEHHNCQVDFTPAA